MRKKFVPILIVCQRWRHSEKAITDITFDLDVILISGFFFKKSHVFWRCFSWKNKITCFFWSEHSVVRSYLRPEHCVKSVRIRSYSVPNFPEFGPNLSATLRIYSKCRKMRTRITPKTDTFYSDLRMHL